jgi:hypothetical protein
MSKDARRHGSGPSKLLLGFEHCREMMIDFQVLPHVVDAQGYARLFKVSACVCSFRCVYCCGACCYGVFPYSVA